jgi:uncharacterized C2H2 Zn-finger protein
MTKYECSKCSKIFRQKSDYDRHLKRKKPCSAQIHNIPQEPIEKQKDKVKTNECKYCHNIFSRSDVLSRHIDKYCKIRKSQDDSKEQLFQKLLTEHEEMTIEIKRLRKENKKMEQIIKQNIKRHVHQILLDSGYLN